MGNDSLVCDFFPFFKDGQSKRYINVPKVPPSVDPTSGVGSKDVVISTRPYVSARIFIPRISDPPKKLPLLVYYHGGGFCVGSAFGRDYHSYITSLVAQANVVAVSVEYRLAPEQPLHVCYEDSWVALRWVALHSGGCGPDAWLNNYADFGRVFLSGESAGANIAYNMTVWVGSGGITGFKLSGLALVHPSFVGVDFYERMILYLIGGVMNDRLQDRRLKPVVEDMARIGCGRVLVFIAGKNDLREFNRRFCDELKKIISGTVDVVEHQGEGHTFHLTRPLSQNAIDLNKRLVAFINQQGPIMPRSKI